MPEIFYFHGKEADADAERRLTQLASGIGQEIFALEGAATAGDLLLKLQNVPPGEPILLFLHFGPLAMLREGRQKGLDLVVSKAAGALGRIFAIVVSGGGVADARVEAVAEAAKSKGFAGFSWWREDIEQADWRTLKGCIDRFLEKFAAGDVGFDDFHKLLHPQRPVALEILDELTNTIGVASTSGSVSAIELIGRIRGHRFGGDLLDDSGRESLAKLAEKRVAWQRTRARLKHDSLGNDLLLSLASCLKIAEGTVIDLYFRERISELCQKWVDVSADLQKLLDEGESTMSPQMTRDIFGKALGTSESALHEAERAWSAKMEDVRRRFAACRAGYATIADLATSSDPKNLLYPLQTFQASCHRFAKSLGDLR